MKILAGILGAYLLALSCLPCHDEGHINGAQAEQGACTLVSAPLSQGHDHCADLCSPLCACSCCGSVTFSGKLSGLSLKLPAPESRSMRFHYQSLYSSTYAPVFLRPPISSLVRLS